MPACHLRMWSAEVEDPYLLWAMVLGGPGAHMVGGLEQHVGVLPMGMHVWVGFGLPLAPSYLLLCWGRAPGLGGVEWTAVYGPIGWPWSSAFWAPCWLG